MKFLKPWYGILIIVVCSLLFSLAYYQAPLFSSNQYQYFLHGMARAGTGTLSEDWLVTTVDPTPVFSSLVYLTELIRARVLFYFYYACLMGIYLFSLVSIAGTIFPIQKSRQSFLIFMSGMILFHSAGLRFLLTQIPGADWGFLFDGGVAGQRLLGQVFQPSVFGVFLLLSIALYLQKRHSLACLSVVLAAIVHPTYLLSSAVLILAYMIDLFLFENQKKKAIGIGLLAVVTVSPIAMYTFLNFMGGSAEIAARAREILVTIRIPHHAQISEWFDFTTGVKLLLIIGALTLVHSRKKFLLIALPLGISILLTLIQFITGSRTLALLFPWRISTWLVPIALAIILGKIATGRIANPSGKRIYSTILPLFLILLSVVPGVGHSWVEVKELKQSASLPLEEYVSEHALPGEVYLIPVKMYGFRLNAGVPVYGDFFAIPYRYDEVIEWYSRFLNAKHFYESGDCELLVDLANQGVTHVVLEADFMTTCPQNLEQVYSDEAYQLLSFIRP